MKIFGPIFLSLIILIAVVAKFISIAEDLAPVRQVDATSFMKSIVAPLPQHMVLDDVADMQDPSIDVFPEGADFNGSYWLMPTASALGEFYPQSSFRLFKYANDQIVSLGLFNPRKFASRIMTTRHGEGDTWLLFGDEPSTGYIFDVEQKIIVHDLRNQFPDDTHIIDASWHNNEWIAILTDGKTDKDPGNSIVKISKDGEIQLIGNIPSVYSILSDGNQLFFISSYWNRRNSELTFVGNDTWGDLWSYENGNLVKNNFFIEGRDGRKWMVYDGKNILFVVSNSPKTLYQLLNGKLKAIGKLPGNISGMTCNQAARLCGVFLGDGQYLFDADTLTFSKFVNYSRKNILKGKTPTNFFLYPSRRYIIANAEFFSERSSTGVPTGDMSAYIFNNDTMQDFEIARGGKKPNLICTSASCIYWDSSVGSSSPRAYYLY